jgi:hypothetical protein
MLAENPEKEQHEVLGYSASGYYAIQFFSLPLS